MQSNKNANVKRPQMPPPEEVAPAARRLMRLADKVALASLDAKDGAPFLSLTGVATLIDATPVLLLSTLARHTGNLMADGRAALLFDGTGDHANPLTESRLSVKGTIKATDDPHAVRRFMARHPKAFYAGFSDFGYYTLEIEDAHYVGGFGVALGIPPDVLRLQAEDTEPLLNAEPGILEHMNNTQAEALRAIAHHLLGGPDGAWLLTGVDPEGADLVLRKHKRRLDFTKKAKAIDDLREQFVEFSKKAQIVRD